MSNATHTPGPWHASYTKLSNVCAENGAVIARCENLTSLSQLGANARLIAAAPELLAALKGICDELDERQGYASYEAYDKARAAIAKATGATE